MQFDALEKRCRRNVPSPRPGTGKSFRLLLGTFPIANWSQSHHRELKCKYAEESNREPNVPSGRNAMLFEMVLAVPTIVQFKIAGARQLHARIEWTTTTVDTINASKLKLIYVVLWQPESIYEIITIIFGYLVVAAVSASRAFGVAKPY